MKNALIAIALTLFLGCSKDEDSDDTTGENPDSENGQLIIEQKATAVIEATVTALSSVSEGESFGTLSKDSTSAGSLTIITGDNSNNSNLIDGSDGPSSDNPNCSGNGTPYDGNGSELDTGEEGYIIKKFYCLLHDKQSPDVVLGAISIMKGFICMAEKQEGFDYSVEGTKVTYSYDNVLAHDDAKDCFPKEVLENSEDDQEEDGGDGSLVYRGEITGYLLSEGPWTHRINIKETETSDDEGPEEPEDTYFLVTKDKAAFKRGDLSASLDYETGELRFENLETRHGRHTRFYVKGDLNEDGSFTTISTMQGLQSQVGSDALTVKGTNDDGFVYSSYYYDCSDCVPQSSQNSGTSSVMEKITGGEWRFSGGECLGTSGSGCDKSNGISFSSTEDASFIATNNPDLISSKINPWIESHEPLCFSEVTTSLLPDDDCSFTGSDSDSDE